MANTVDIKQLPEGNKVENNGANAQGKLRSSEYNQLIKVLGDLINAHNNLDEEVARALGDITIEDPMIEEAFATLIGAGELQPHTLYLTFED